MWELLLLRHGKSDWPNGIEDIDRPLRPRGQKLLSSVYCKLTIVDCKGWVGYTIVG